MCRNQQIVAHHLSAHIENGANERIVERRRCGEVQNREVTQKLIERCLVLLPPRRDLDPVHQLGLGNRRDADIADRDHLKPLEDNVVSPLHDVGRDICVEHVDSHQSERS